MFIDFITAVFTKSKNVEAIVWRNHAYSYGWLLKQMQLWRKRVHAEAIIPGTVTVLEADFSPNVVALFLVLVERGCILVPLTSAVQAKKEEFLRIAKGEVSIRIDDNDDASVARLGNGTTNEIYAELRSRGHPGLVLFSSGSTGESKAAVHDLLGILEKFKEQRHTRRTIAFLMFDHIGGINTMLYTLANAGCMVTIQDRGPDAVLQAVERHKVDLLPTSPTFINLMLLSEAYKQYDLSSLRLVTYGTEPMPQSTLKRFHDLFPEIRLLQTYGLSEVGILRSKSKSSDSLWVKVGGEGFQTRIVDGILHIKSDSAMLGYLNAPSPFTDDGWFVTGDVVEQNGEYIRILGRESEIINVGGQKVYPAEVESVIQCLDNIAGAVVYSERNPITGQIVCARVSLQQSEDPKVAVRRVKRSCRERLEPFKVPVKVSLVDRIRHTDRFKKCRPR